MKNDNSSLKDQLQRSLRELRAYQVKYPSPYAAQLGAENEEPDASLWSLNAHAINPLLEAYDTRKSHLSFFLFLIF